MHLLDYVLLGIIQGLTEFLPVSSSTHLVLAEHWLHFNPPGVVTEITLHVATLLAVVVVYAKDLWRMLAKRDWRYMGLLLLATIVTVAVVFPIKDWLKAETESPYAVRIEGGMLLITAAWLWLTDRRLRRNPGQLAPTWRSALWIGLAQGLGALPGISRSGATIGAGIQMGIGREEAARFSFLLSIPVIVGAALLDARAMTSDLASGAVSTVGLALGFIAALATGMLAIYLLLWVMKRARLVYFAYYCVALSIVALIIG